MIGVKEKATRNGLRTGLTDRQAEESRRENGSNVISKRKGKSFIRRFFENLGDPVIRILLAALAVDIIFVFRGGNVLETVGIGVSVFLAAFISALSESGGENAFRKLAGESDRAEYRVVRNGKTVSLSIDDIVVGDVVHLCAGEKVPADGFVISGNMSVDQSSITGESKEIKKAPAAARASIPSASNAVMRGCPIISGEGDIEVCAVGDNSFLGRISIEVQRDTRESPLKVRLTKLAKQISVLGYVAAALIALAYLFNCIFIDSGFEWILIAMKVFDLEFMLSKLLHAFMLGLTVIVVAVPDGTATVD